MLSTLMCAVLYINARWNRSDEGATAVEYGLLVAFIGLVIAVAAATLGGAVSGLFNSASGELTSQVTNYNPAN